MDGCDDAVFHGRPMCLARGSPAFQIARRGFCLAAALPPLLAHRDSEKTLRIPPPPKRRSPSCSPVPVAHPIGSISMVFVADQGSAAAAFDDERGGGGHFTEPSQHGDSSTMVVIRDALLSQLQHDRLRQEIIMGELAKIESAMALRSAGAGRGNPAATFVPSNEHFTPHSGGAVGAERGVGADDEVHGLKKEDGVVHDDGVELKPEKVGMEDFAGDECSKTCCGTEKTAGQENAALNECKMQEQSSETMLPKTTPPSSVAWSCSICQAEASSEGNLQQHFAGQKHQSKVAALLSRRSADYHKATPIAEQASKVRQYGAEKPHPTWLCRFCQSNCTSQSNLENHLRGKRHKAKLQALLDECKNMATNIGSTEVKLDPQNVTQDEYIPVSTWNCSLCQAKCTRQSELENHLKGKRHQLNFLVLQVEAQQYLSEWGCSICQAKCKYASQFEDHCRGRRHQQKIEALLRGGTNPRPGGCQVPKKPPSDGSNSRAESSEEMGTQRTLYFCKLCNLHCNSKNTLAEHRQGKKHIENVGKRMSLSFCEVCNLQCNSEKMLAHHSTGKTHLAKVKTPDWNSVEQDASSMVDFGHQGFCVSSAKFQLLWHSSWCALP